MKKLILLDLDDTLLDTKIDQFLPHYFAALGEKLKHILPPQKMINLVLEATRYMMQEPHPDVINARAFAEYFFARIPVPQSEIKPQIADFYERNFPELRKYVNALPAAREFVSYLFECNFQVVIATNPLFPARAIEHRMDWAGISGFPYVLVTTYENSHFSKPNPAYYQEILDKCGFKAGDSLMIGDNLQNDIIPARKVGIQTYHINSGEEDRFGETGSLEQCFEWIKSLRKHKSRP